MASTFRLRALAPAVLGTVLVAVLALLLRSPAPAAHTRPVRALAAGQVTVAISDYAFGPAKLTVRAGTRITFVNHDDTAHTATANGGAFDTGVIQPHHSRTIRVTRPGTYPYHCIFHAFMTGTITVVG